jgi:hypothetical protein
MKKLLLVLIASGLSLGSALAGNFYNYDNNGNYSWGRLDPSNGSFYRYDNNGNYS